MAKKEAEETVRIEASVLDERFRKEAPAPRDFRPEGGGHVPTTRQVQAFLDEHVSCFPGSRAKCEESPGFGLRPSYRLLVFQRVQDADVQDYVHAHEIEVVTVRDFPVSDFYARPWPEVVMEQLYEAFLLQQEHELKEWLKVDGRNYAEPHP